MVIQHEYPRPSFEEYYCPRCGRPVTESDLWDSGNEYPFQCEHCDEDFYSIECLAMCDMERMKKVMVVK